MKVALALAAALLVLFGCAGVSQEQYDSLKAACDQEKGALSKSLSDERLRNDQLGLDLASCKEDRQAISEKQRAMEEEVALAKNATAAYGAAKEKAELAAAYTLALEYYNDAFGPGAIANTARLNLIEQAVAAVGDSQLSSYWKSLRNCQGFVACDAAKAGFVQRAESRVAALEKEIVEVLG